MRVRTNIGLVPMRDYLDIRAMSYGFDDYEDLKKHGGHIEVSPDDLVPDEEGSSSTSSGYCNCCGATFAITDEDNVVCPDCGCEYSDENEYIEVFNN